MTRELSITYGAVTVGGSSGREITGWLLNTKKSREAVLEFEFDIYKTTEATFASEISTIEEAFRKPYQDVTVTQGITTLYTYSQSANTGLDAQPEIVKREENATGRSRRYRVRIVVGLPGNTGAELVTGLVEHSVEVSYGPSRIRTVSITGVFTAISGSNARTQYNAQISSLETSVFTALGIAVANRELIEEPQQDSTYNTKTVSFRRVWRELIFSQGGSTFNDSAIVKQLLRISRKTEQPGDAPNVKRLIILSVNYDCWIDKDVTTDLTQKYSSIRSWLVSKVKDVLDSSGSIAITEEEPDYNLDENRISARWMVQATSGSNLLARTVAFKNELVPGWLLVAAWTGDPMSKYSYRGPASRRITITDTKTIRGFVYFDASEYSDGGASIMADVGIAGVKPPSGFESRHLSQEPTFTHRRLGTSANHIDVTDITKIDVFEFFKPIAASADEATS